MDDSGLRERVIGEIEASMDVGHDCYTNRCVLADRILTLVDIEYRPLLMQAWDALNEASTVIRVLSAGGRNTAALDAIAALDERLGGKK